MKRIACLVLLSLSAAASAQQQPPVLVAQPQPGTDSTINLQTSSGSSCAAPTVGNCGSCSVACPSGHAAMCKPGLAVNAQAGASCVTPPECKCQ